MSFSSESAGSDLHVFVYGTLRHGEINDIALAARRHDVDAPVLIGRADVPGQLFDFGQWPGLVPPRSTGWDPDRRERVFGDVYRISAALLPILDDIEGIRADGREAFYRAVCEVHVDDVRYGCLYYPVDVESVVHCPPIAEGDWVAYRLARTVQETA